MAINQFLRLKDAKPTIEMGQRPPQPPKPKKLPVAGPPAMPQVLAGLMRTPKHSNFYGD